MAIEVNGVTLPDIPADVLASYPYAYVIEVTTPDITTYLFLALKDESVFIPAHLDVDGLPTLVHDKEKSEGVSGELSNDTWVLYGDGSADRFSMPVGEITQGYSYNVIYANYDIYTAVSYDANTFTVVKGDKIYFPNSEVTYATEYRVPTDDLLVIADQVRRLTGNSGKLTTEQMGSELSGVEKGIVLAPNERIYQVGTAVSVFSGNITLNSSTCNGVLQ